MGRHFGPWVVATVLVLSHHLCTALERAEVRGCISERPESDGGHVTHASRTGDDGR